MYAHITVLYHSPALTPMNQEHKVTMKGLLDLNEWLKVLDFSHLHKKASSINKVPGTNASMTVKQPMLLVTDMELNTNKGAAIDTVPTCPGEMLSKARIDQMLQAVCDFTLEVL